MPESLIVDTCMNDFNNFSGVYIQSNFTKFLFSRGKVVKRLDEHETLDSVRPIYPPFYAKRKNC